MGAGAKVKEIAIAAERRYQALLYEFYAEETRLGDEEQPPPVTEALGAGGSCQELLND